MILGELHNVPIFFQPVWVWAVVFCPPRLSVKFPVCRSTSQAVQQFKVRGFLKPSSRWPFETVSRHKALGHWLEVLQPMTSTDQPAPSATGQPEWTIPDSPKNGDASGVRSSFQSCDCHDCRKHLHWLFLLSLQTGSYYNYLT